MPSVREDGVGHQACGSNGDEAGDERPMKSNSKLSSKKRVREKMANKAASQAAPNGTTAKERRTLETKPKWPRVIDAPVRDAMPGAIPLGPSGSLDVLEAQRDDWEAPWMVGLVNRVDDGTENDPDSKGGVFNNRRSELDGFDKTGSVDGEVEIIDLVDGTSGQTGRSDLHHEIVRFSEYVSLTPAEKKARERLISCVTEVAVEAFGPGATVEAFGSYGDNKHGGLGTAAPGGTFSIFLSDVDVNVRPDCEVLDAAKNNSESSLEGSRLTLDAINFPGGPKNGNAFEEGSTSSSSNSDVSGETGSDGIETVSMDILGEAEASKGATNDLGDESEQKRVKSGDDHTPSSAANTALDDDPATNGFPPEKTSIASPEVFEIVVDRSPDPAVQNIMTLEKEREDRDKGIVTSLAGIEKEPQSIEDEEVCVAAVLKVSEDKTAEKGGKRKRGDTQDYATDDIVILRDSGSSESLRALNNPGKGGLALMGQSSCVSACEKCDAETRETGRLESQQQGTDVGLAARNAGSVTLPLPNGLEFNMRSEVFPPQNSGVGSSSPAFAVGTPEREGPSIQDKQSVVAGLMKFGKRLRKKPWVVSYEIRSHAKVPIVVWRDARNGVECDVAWGGDGQADVIRTQPGPGFFADMFPGIFKPLAQFLKVFMRQRGIDKPNTGGVGSFKLYALIAAFLTRGKSSKPGAADLGELLMGFFSHYSRRKSLTRNTVLCIKNLQVDLSSAWRISAVTKIFREAFDLLSIPISDSSNPWSSLKAGGSSTLKAGGRRGSLLRRVVWGDDLRRERETRLAAANSRKMSPYPRGPEPVWHSELKAKSETGAAVGTGKLLKSRVKLHPRLLEKFNTLRDKRLFRLASTRDNTAPTSNADGIKSKRHRKKARREKNGQSFGRSPGASGVARENGQCRASSAQGNSSCVAQEGKRKKRWKKKARLMGTSGSSAPGAPGVARENGQCRAPPPPGSSRGVAQEGKKKKKQNWKKWAAKRKKSSEQGHWVTG